MRELKGQSVAIQVDEPFELIAKDDLTIHGNVTEVMQHPETMRIAIASDDPRLENICWISASPRHQGDSFASLVPGSPLVVHGIFLTAQGDDAGSGYIGLLRIVS